jgi:hypothetical protein
MMPFGFGDQPAPLIARWTISRDKIEKEERWRLPCLSFSDQNQPDFLLPIKFPTKPIQAHASLYEVSGCSD